MTEYLWTSHAEWKMKYYGLSRQKVSGIIRRPDRVEKGIAGNNTVAVMQAVSPKMIEGRRVWKQEVWTMYQSQKPVNTKQATKNDQQATNRRKQEIIQTASNVTVEELRNALSKKFQQGGKIKIISAWRYPGVSPKNKPIPEEILRELTCFDDMPDGVL